MSEIIEKPKRWPSEKQLTERARALLGNNLEPGTRITNGDLCVALECPDLARAQAALRRARKWALATHGRWYKSEPGRGYVVLAAQDHDGEIVSRRSRIRRIGREALALATHARIEEIEDPRRLEALIRQRNIVAVTLWTERRASGSKSLSGGDVKALPSGGDLLRMIDGTRKKRDTKSA